MEYGSFDVYINSSPSGRLEISRQGLLTCFECTAPESSDILRLAGDTGKAYEVIGVMMPEGGGLHLKKYLTKNDLYIKKLDTVKRYVLIENGAVYPAAEPAFPDAEKSSPEAEEDDKAAEAVKADKKEGSGSLWHNCSDPGSLFDDAEAARALSGADGVLTAEKDGFVYIAVPVDPEKPFPAMPIFCFGNQGTIGGREYLVFRTKDGRLQI